MSTENMEVLSNLLDNLSIEDEEDAIAELAYIDAIERELDLLPVAYNK